MKREGLFLILLTNVEMRLMINFQTKIFTLTLQFEDNNSKFVLLNAATKFVMLYTFERRIQHIRELRLLNSIIFNFFFLHHIIIRIKEMRNIKIYFNNNSDCFDLCLLILCYGRKIIVQWSASRRRQDVQVSSNTSS